MKPLVATAVLFMFSALVAGCVGGGPVEITSHSGVEELAASCAEITSPVFLVRRTRPQIQEEQLLRYVIVKPGTLFAPFSVEAYERGEAEADELAEIVRVVPAGTQLEVESVWSIRGFEGEILSVSTIVDAGEAGDTTADMASLLDTNWRLDLADGKISELENSRLRGRPLFDPEYARPCAP